jgi:hypothetical protein
VPLAKILRTFGPGNVSGKPSGMLGLHPYETASLAWGHGKVF